MLLLLICVCIPSHASFVYMGGTIPFTPLGSDSTTLTLSGGESRLMPIHCPRGYDMQLTLLCTSPLPRQNDKSFGFAYTDILSGDTTKLLLCAPGADDDIYTPAPLRLHISSPHATHTMQSRLPLTAEALHEKALAFTLLIQADGTLRIIAGRTLQAELFDSIPLNVTPADISAIGVAAHAGSMEISRVNMLTSPGSDIVHNGLSLDEIQSSITQPDDPYTGYWTLLDTTFDTSRILSGGQYRLAMIPGADEGYDLIYMDGALINPASWTAGLIKAHLWPTPMPGIYNLQWIDAEHIPVPGHAILQFNGTDLCTISFPSHSSTFRLHRDR